ncbi:MAG: fibronectin type III domain-containing protein [Candidatus Pacebacteria bacterium]|nr:fibronectin type III domain-containing protein [Candidatus Paceibacterota bacterium]
MKLLQKTFLLLSIIVLVFSVSYPAKAIPLNTAPLLDASKSPTLSSVNEDAPNPVGAVGTLVSSLVDSALQAGGLDNVSDSDGGALLGLAITGIDSGLTCSYSLDNGSTWTAFGLVSSGSARLLAADSDNRIYCKAGANINGSFPTALTFRAWDQTSGSDGGTADTTTNGSPTAFSTVTDTVFLLVNSVNDAPSGTNLSAAEVYQKNTSFNLIPIVVSDVDNSTVTVTLTLSNPPAGSLSTDTVGAVTSTYDAETGIWIASGAIADVNSLLGNLTFAPATDFTNNFTIATEVSDGTDSTSGSKSVTYETVPDAPTALTTTALLQSYVHLSWTAPDDGGSVITGYKIERESPVGSGWSTLVDNTESDATTYNDQAVLPDVEYNYRVRAINDVGSGNFGDPASVITPSVTPGTVCVADAHWNFDEGDGTTAIESVNGHNGTLVNGPTYSTDVPPVHFTDPYSLLFNEESDQKVTFLRSATTTYSVSFWIKPLGQSDTYGSLFSQNADVGLYYLGNDIEVSLRNKISNYYGNSGDHPNNTALSLNTWHHIALVNDDGNATIYLDGTPDGTMTGSPAIAFNTLGSDPSHEAFNGYIDDVRIYDSVLTANEVHSLAEGNENCDGSSATPTPAPRHRSGGGSSVGARVTNLIAMNKKKEAQDLVEKYQNNSQNVTNITPPSFVRDLMLGLSGDDVKRLQIFLNGHGYPLATTGPGSPQNETNFFGALTRAALAKFQKANGIIPAAGYFGPKTKAFVASMK